MPWVLLVCLKRCAKKIWYIVALTELKNIEPFSRYLEMSQMSDALLVKKNWGVLITSESQSLLVKKLGECSLPVNPSLF